MLVEVAIAQLLRDNAGVAAIVGARIIPLVLDANVDYPAVLYRAVHGGEHYEDLDGSSGLRRTRLGIYATHSKGRTNYKPVLQLAEAVRLALHGFSGTVTLDNSSPVESIFIGNISAGPFEDRFDDPTQTYQRLQIYDVWSNEDIPTFS